MRRDGISKRFLIVVDPIRSSSLPAPSTVLERLLLVIISVVVPDASLTATIESEFFNVIVDVEEVDGTGEEEEEGWRRYEWPSVETGLRLLNTVNSLLLVLAPGVDVPPEFDPGVEADVEAEAVAAEEGEVALTARVRPDTEARPAVGVEVGAGAEPLALFLSGIAGGGEDDDDDVGEEDGRVCD